MTLTGVFSSLFLPETLHQNLPNTIREAKSFGMNQNFWHLPKKPEKVPDEEMVKLKTKN
jgi:OCT family organic cation transporter-like MFS transporter 4/5